MVIDVVISYCIISLRSWTRVPYSLDMAGSKEDDRIVAGCRRQYLDMHGMYIGDVQAKEQSYTRELVLMFNFFFFFMNL